MILLAAIIGLIVLAILTIFQILLAIGKPFGNYAWGGRHKVLPLKLRISSLSSIAIYVVFALFIISKSGIALIISSPEIISFGVWTMTVYMCIGVFLNAISRSKKERYTMTPIASILAISFFILAIS